MGTNTAHMYTVVLFEGSIHKQVSKLHLENWFKKELYQDKYDQPKFYSYLR